MLAGNLIGLKKAPTSKVVSSSLNIVASNCNRCCYFFCFTQYLRSDDLVFT